MTNDTDQHKDTFFSRAQADADLSAQGRFKRETATRITSVPEYPKQPANSPWASDPVPPNPVSDQLGYSIDAMPDLGGPSSPAATPPAVETSDPPDLPSSSTLASSVEQGDEGTFSSDDEK
jgi:hypothetical protein